MNLHWKGRMSQCLKVLLPLSTLFLSNFEKAAAQNGYYYNKNASVDDYYADDEYYGNSSGGYYNDTGGYYGDNGTDDYYNTFRGNDDDYYSYDDDYYYYNNITSNNTALQAEQEEILLNFYQETSGERWRKSTNWFSEMHVCYWFGIECYSDGARFGLVRSIDLQDNKISGTPPKELFNLPYLQTLEMKNNPGMTFSFEGIGNAFSLSVLKLSGIMISSFDGIQNARSLEYLHITESGLSIPFPEELYEVRSLKGLYANFNKFSGPLSPKIRKMRNLEEFFVLDNELSGPIPTEIGLCSQITSIALARNALTGTIPKEINNLSFLTIVALQENNKKESVGLSGPIPSFTNNFMLEGLYLSNNALTGNIPNQFLSGIRNRGKEVTVDLSFNNLHGSIPESLLRFPRLELNLAENKIDSLQKSFCKQSKWQNGDVGRYGCDAIMCPPGTYSKAGRQTSESSKCQTCTFENADFFGSSICGASITAVSSDRAALEKFYESLDGKFWKSQTNWLSPDHSVCEWYGITCDSNDASGNPVITKISLSANELMGTVPQEIFLLDSLEFLDLSGNNIEFTFLGIENAKSLTKLYLASTGLASVKGISRASKLDMLDIGNNKNLNTSSLDEILQIQSLRALLISHNDFAGPIPSGIENLSQLLYLRAYGSGFNGKIPSEIGSLSNLLVLDIAENDFTGTIPTELNQLVNLELISIHQVGKSGAGISGPIPSFSELKQLTELYLDSNSFTGNLPPDLLSNSEKLSGKIIIGLSKNQLEGDIPLDYTRFNNLEIDLTDNRIGGIPKELCAKEQWQNGLVASFKCNAILCPTETFSSFGKQSTSASPCQPCSSVGKGISPFLGATSCLFDKSGFDTFSQRDLLEIIFYMTGGRNWNNNLNWLNEAAPICDWYGVSCEPGDVEDKVVEIDLTDNGIYGEIPSETWRLPYLETLKLKGNAITVLFDGIENASNLKYLQISETGLTTFEGIHRAPAIEFLHATDNNLPGSFPTDLLRLSNLKELYLNYNEITGKLPQEINTLVNLEELYLLHNQLTGQIPDTIGDLKNLTLLTLSDNDLSGTLPEELNNLEKLEILSLDGNNKRNGRGITGPLIDFSALTSLKGLYLQSNSLTGTIPKSFLGGIKNKADPIDVHLVSNDLEGGVPAELSSFSKMQFYVEDNKIEAVDLGICEREDWMNGDVGLYQCDGILCPPNTFNEFGRHTNDAACEPCPGMLTAPYYGSISCISDQKQQSLLEEQILSNFYEALSGSDWKVNANWMDTSVSICDWYGITCVSSEEPSIKSISLPRNGLAGPVPSDVFSLPSLREIDFSYNDIQFSFDGINAAKSLEYLNLDDIGLKSLKGIEQASNLSVLHLMSNKFFQNTIPEALFSLSQLEILYLSDNFFSGELPVNMKELSNLKYFSCFSCGLTGKVPEWIGQLSNLEYLRLDENSFTGELPASLSDLQNIQHLDLSQQSLYGGKGFTGTLPDFSGLTNLGELFLYSNSISGTIPSTFINGADKDDSIEVDLRFNDIRGDVPIELATFERLTIDLAGNRIDSLSTSLCSKSGWMHGDVRGFKCSGILCPPKSYNSEGRQSPTSDPCLPCPENVYFGSTACGIEYDDDDSVSNIEEYNPDDYINASGREILELFYRETRGYSWLRNGNWLKGPNPCKWHGVQCTDNKVTSINLESNGLVGKVPMEIFRMKFLQSLNLKGNPVQFSFKGIENAAELKELVLSDMGLTSIKGVGKAPGLEIIHLTNNEIEGEIPDALFELGSLTEIYANYNKFSGLIPTKIGQLSKLNTLFLFHNMLSGQLPSELGQLSNLETVTLAENLFTGTLPSELNNLANIDVFALGFQPELTGPLLSFSGWKKVKELYLGSNDLTGNIPVDFLSGVIDKTEAIRVDLTLNKLSGIIPKELGEFDNLRFNVAGNMISGIGEGLCKKNGWLSGSVGKYHCSAILCPPSTYNEYGRQPTEDAICKPCKIDGAASHFGSVECSDGSNVLFDNDIPEIDVLINIYDEVGGSDWTDNSNWGNKNVDFCDWYGVVCASEEGGKHVTKLQLGSNNLIGTLPYSVYALPALTHLEVQDNPDLEVQFTNVGSARKLSFINIDKTNVNSLTGIGDVDDALVSLSMQDNDFGGINLPQELFSFPRLKYLNIANSNLVGPLPPDIGQLASLEEFHCSGNGLTGQIPFSIGNLSKIRVLAMSENDFSGTLPKEIGELRSLQGLYIDSFSRFNRGITGPLLSFNNSPELMNLYLGGNFLLGSIPSDFLSGIGDTLGEVNIVLKSNLIQGTIPATLAKFKLLNIDLSGNRIEGMHPDLCQKRGWMGGMVEDYQCDAILCPPGTFNMYGRQSTDESPCEECIGISVLPYYGALECGSRTKEKEREILELFFHTCGGEYWKNSENWLDQDKDYCDWFGISCHDEGLVDSILMGSNNIIGTPPKELFQLEHLKWLWLYSNPITFGFEEIERATKLSSLLLDSTSTTSISGVGKALSLTEFDMRFNNLEGLVPDDEMRNLVNLVSLSLSDNSLSGPLPPSLGELTNLKKLRLGNNKFEGTLPDFSDHPDLISLDLSDNKLTGTIPSTLLKDVAASDEIFLDLSSNRLTGTIPGELVRFDLMTIYLRENHISGIHPSICTKSDWMDGDVGDFDCEGLLCKPGSYSDFGRETKAQECKPCRLASYYGSSNCGESSSSTRIQLGFTGAISMIAFIIVSLFAVM